MTRVLEIMPLASSAMAFIGDQLSFLKDNGGYDMHLITSPGEEIEAFAMSEGAEYMPVEIPRPIRPWQDIKNLWKIYRYIRKHKINVVIGHQSKGVLYGMVAGRLAGAQYRIVLAHGVLEDTMTGLKQKVFATENRICSMCATHVLCVSPSVMKRRVKLGIDKPKKQYLLGKGTCNGIDASSQFNPQNVPDLVIEIIRNRYGLTKADFVVGFCGRLVRDKGVVELTEAIKLLHERFPDKSVKLFVIGSPEKRDAIPEDTIHFMKESDHVVFTGRVDHSEIQNYYSVMDVFVLPSYREGFPTVVLEASAMELPMVVSRSTGCIDSIVEHETGIYCDIDPESIADAITFFFDKEKARQYGEAGRAFVVENFEHSIIREQMLLFLDNITLTH